MNVIGLGLLFVAGHTFLNQNLLAPLSHIVHVYNPRAVVSQSNLMSQSGEVTLETNLKGNNVHTYREETEITWEFLQLVSFPFN